MRVELTDNACIVTREPGDPRFHAGGWGSSESQFLHHVKRELRKQGHDVVKRRAWADGHTFGYEYTHYLRDRKWGWCLVDASYYLRDCGEDFNKFGQVTLMREVWAK